MIPKKIPVHFCLVVGDYVLEEVNSVAYLSKLSGSSTPSIYSFENGLGGVAINSLTTEILDQVFTHLQKFNGQKTFRTNFQQAIFAGTLKAPTPEMEFGRKLKQAFAIGAVIVGASIPLVSIVTPVISTPVISTLTAAVDDAGDKEEEKEDEGEGETEEDEGGSYCSDNPNAKGCEKNEDGDVGMKR